MTIKVVSGKVGPRRADRIRAGRAYRVLEAPHGFGAQVGTVYIAHCVKGRCQGSPVGLQSLEGHHWIPDPVDWVFEEVDLAVTVLGPTPEQDW